jgi:hypothetical protein
MSLRVASQTAQASGLRLRRAVPRRPGHLLVELIDEQSGIVAGQWFDDPAEAARVARGTTDAAAGGQRVRLLAGRLVVQPDGADRRLPALRRLLTVPDTTLVAHRPERRGVVRRGPEHWDPERRDVDHRGPECRPTYSKVVRPDRVGGVLGGLTGGRTGGLRTPVVVDVDHSHGVVTTSALPGTTLHDLLTTDRTLDQWWHTGEAVGRSIGLLHGAALAATTPAHDAGAELGVCRRWLEMAANDGLLDLADPAVARAWGSAARGLEGGPTVVAPVHRDLHDKQLLVDGGGGIGVLDLDLLAAGDPALDLANLLVHLELRVRQGVADRDSAVACAAGLLAGHRADPRVGDAGARLSGYAWATRLRLLAVYAFRPASAAAARALVIDPDPLIAECR